MQNKVQISIKLHSFETKVISTTQNLASTGSKYMRDAT